MTPPSFVFPDEYERTIPPWPKCNLCDQPADYWFYAKWDDGDDQQRAACLVHVPATIRNFHMLRDKLPGPVEVFQEVIEW